MTTIGPIGRDAATAEFLDAAAAGVFLLRRCPRDDAWAGPQERRCPACGADDLRWAPASGEATVVTFSVVHGAAGNDGPRPVSVVVVAEFDEGPWWWTQLVDADPADVAIGARLRAAFAGAEGSETVPVFRLA